MSERERDNQQKSRKKSQSHKLTFFNPSHINKYYKKKKKYVFVCMPPTNSPKEEEEDKIPLIK